MNNSIGNQLYSGAATVGRIGALVGAIVGTIFGLLFLAAGIWLLVKKPQMTDTKTGKKISKSSDTKLGGVFIGVSLLVIMIAWGSYYLTRKSKGFAAIEGASDIIHML